MRIEWERRRKKLKNYKLRENIGAFDLNETIYKSKCMNLYSVINCIKKIDRKIGILFIYLFVYELSIQFERFFFLVSVFVFALITKRCEDTYVRI